MPDSSTHQVLLSQSDSQLPYAISCSSSQTIQLSRGFNSESLYPLLPAVSRLMQCFRPPCSDLCCRKPRAIVWPPVALPLIVPGPGSFSNIRGARCSYNAPRMRFAVVCYVAYLKMDATSTHSVRQSVADVLMAVAATNGLRSLRHSIIRSKARRTRIEGGRNRPQCKRPA